MNPSEKTMQMARELWTLTVAPLTIPYAPMPTGVPQSRLPGTIWDKCHAMVYYMNTTWLGWGWQHKTGDDFVRFSSPDGSYAFEVPLHDLEHQDLKHLQAVYCYPALRASRAPAPQAPFTPREHRVNGGTLLLMERTATGYKARWKGGSKLFEVGEAELVEMERG